MRVDEHTFYLDESPVYYRSAETSGMPKLYLHGIPTSSDDWLEILVRTGGIAPDLIGFGRSGKGGHLDYSLAGLADFLERFLTHVAVDQVQIVGHDWGAAVAEEFASRHPGDVRRLVLVNPPPRDPSHWPRVLRLWRTRGVGELVMGATSKRILARTLRRGCVRPDAWPDSRVDAVWSQFDQGTQRAVLRLVRSEAGGARPPGMGAGTDAPTAAVTGAATTAGAATTPSAPTATRPAIVWGEADPWYPPALADAYAARLPGATVEPIAGAGHWPWLDRPEVVDRVAALLEG